MSSNSLLKAIAPAARVSSVLDKGRGSILGVCVHRDRIEMGVVASASGAGHLHRIELLPPLETARPGCEGSGRGISAAAVEMFREVVDENRVGGFVVSWPLNLDTGRMGASCGRVLFALESIQRASSRWPSSPALLFSPQRPACLWHPAFSSSVGSPSPSFPLAGEQEDAWGRSSLHARTSSKEVYLASVESYLENEKTDVGGLWRSFYEAHRSEPSPEIWARRERDRRRAATAAALSLQSEPANTPRGNVARRSNLLPDWMEAATTRAPGKGFFLEATEAA